MSDSYLVNASTSTPSAGWGSTFNFSILTKDPNSDQVNITLLINKSYGWSANTYGTAFCPSCTNYTQESITYKGFTCGDKDTDVYYMFNTTDNSTANGVPWGKTWVPDTAYSFAIVNNNVTFDYKIGNMSEANRGYTAGDSIATLMLYGNDTINQSAVLTNLTVTLRVTTDGSTYTTIPTVNESHAGGNVSFSFNPTCSPTQYGVGLQKWKFITTGVMPTGDQYAGTTAITLQKALNIM